MVTYTLVQPAQDPIVHKAEAIALETWRLLGCCDGGRIDLRCNTAGEPQFMEVNPLAGLHPHHSDLPILCHHLGIAYPQLIDWIVASACRRLRQKPFFEKQKCAS